MGAYLSTPITDKVTCDGSSKATKWATSSMQGWRRTMEDAHLATTYQLQGAEIGIFAVFDGHGGSEVAKFCHRHLAEELTQSDSFQRGNVGEALVQAFHRMDDMLRQPAAAAELEQYRGNGGSKAPMPPLPPPVSAAPTSEQPASTEANDPGDQQTMDVVKRILEIKRMVTAGAASAAAVGSDSPQPQPTPEAAPAQSSGPERFADMKPGKGVDEPDSAEQCGQVGCTAVVAVLKGSELYIANAGDSRAVLGRGRRAVPLSEDHKPASAPEKSRITNAGGFVSEVGGITRVNGNLNLSRAIGDLRYKCNADVARHAQIITAEPDVRRVTIRPEDRFFLMACDGVWDVLSNQQAVDFVNDRLDQGELSSSICEQMLDYCLAKDPKEARGIGCDNMTAQIVTFTQQGQHEDHSPEP